MRVLAWAIGCATLWVGGIWLLTRPQTWRTLALISAHISYGARAAYNITKTHEQRRQEHQAAQAVDTVRQVAEPLPSADVVIEAVRHFLDDQRRDT